MEIDEADIKFLQMCFSNLKQNWNPRHYFPEAWLLDTDRKAIEEKILEDLIGATYITSIYPSGVFLPNPKHSVKVLSTIWIFKEYSFKDINIVAKVARSIPTNVATYTSHFFDPYEYESRNKISISSVEPQDRHIHLHGVHTSESRLIELYDSLLTILETHVEKFI